MLRPYSTILRVSLYLSENNNKDCKQSMEFTSNGMQTERIDTTDVCLQ